MTAKLNCIGVMARINNHNSSYDDDIIANLRLTFSASIAYPG